MKPATHAIAQPEHLLRAHGLTPAHWFYLHLRSARSQRFLYLLQRCEFLRNRKHKDQNQNHHHDVCNSHEIASDLPQDHAIERLCLYFSRCLVPRGDVTVCGPWLMVMTFSAETSVVMKEVDLSAMILIYCGGMNPGNRLLLSETVS